jgi:predicted dehydrogenase
MSYRAGIIGTGGAAGTGLYGVHDQSRIGTDRIRGTHAGGYEACTDIELDAIADIQQDSLNQFGETWDVGQQSRYLDHKKMLQAESLDVVSICTPTSLHAKHVIDAVESPADPGVIWCEKPIAASVGDAESMIDTCEAAGTELVVNHSFRFTEKIQRLRALLQEETFLGDVHAVNLQFRMELLRNATHILDLLAFLLNTRAASVAGYVTGKNEAAPSLEASMAVDDAGGGGHLVLDDGTFVTLDCTVPRDASSMMITLVGSEGKLYLNNDDGEWRYWSLKDGAHVEQPIPDIDRGWTWECDYEDAFPNAADHIASLLGDEGSNLSPGQEAKRSLEIITGIFISHFTSGQVSLPLEPPLKHVEISSW